MLVWTICRSVWFVTVAGGTKPRPGAGAGAGGAAGAPLGGTTTAGATGGPPPGPGPPARGPGSGRDTRAVAQVATHLSPFESASAGEAIARVSSAVNRRMKGAGRDAE